MSSAQDSAFVSRLGAMVGNGRENRPPDVLWAKQAMHCLGRYNDLVERHAYFSLVPIKRYVPTGGSTWYPTYLEGEFRERYLLILTTYLAN